MYENPDSLENLCLNTFCENILYFMQPCFANKKTNSSDEESDVDEPEKYKFCDSDVFLINEISEKLLQKFGDKKILCDATLSLFTEKNTRLRKVKLKNAKISKLGLLMLKQHKLVELECVDLKRVGVGDILDMLNEWTVQNIIAVNFSKCALIDKLRHNCISRITKLKNIRYLDLSYTELNQIGLNIICEDLKFIETLNISGTFIRDLEPILQLSNQLTGLSVSDLYRTENYISTILQLENLQFLDVSLCNEKFEYLQNADDCIIEKLLEDKNTLPRLISLDLSGWKDVISREMLLNYLETHTRLEFLGLVLNDLTFEPSLSDQQHFRYPHNIIIAGLGNEEQIKVALKKYPSRSHYVQKALYYLFQLTNTFEETRADMLKLVLPVMEIHGKKFGVQMAATACLYNLTRGDLSKNLHPNALSTAVTLTMDAMAMFSSQFQLQKNSLLTLCSDRILQEVNFDRFRCTKLVLDSLCNFEDANMNRMALAICSILAAKISTEETSVLGATPLYMRKLLSIVKSRVESRTSDITLKFTLSALWNLTDESAATCSVFLEEKGAILFMDVLTTFRDDSAIETKVLGLLNNIAEVSELRHVLMMEPLLEELCNLLKSENIDVSYFAAGIIAHLASDGADRWIVDKYPRNKMLAELEATILQWKVPDNEMVAYRSFRPFFPLLKINMDYQVQLWAVWAIHHVCTKNSKRYCAMLLEENVHLWLLDLANYADSHDYIRIKAKEILNIM